jgi:membrane-bound metal-dependent hydrolase YbcI (DUF457 family)
VLPPGHIATALLLSRLTRADAPPAVLGVLTPDFIDKPLAWVLHVIPGGRYFAHSLTSTLLLSAVVGRLLGRRTAKGFAVGYLAHLAGDKTFGGHVPWLMPFKKYDTPREQKPILDLTWQEWTFEALSLLFVLAWARRARARASTEKMARPD